MDNSNIIVTVLIAIGLAMDCFAVSLGIGTTRKATPRSIFRLSFHFGLFQCGMTILGWWVGSTIVQWISAFDHWVAFVLLGWVGIRMIIEGFKSEHEDNSNTKDPSRGGSLVMLSIATSLDAMAVGLSLAMIGDNIAISAIIIGIISLVLSLVGLIIGHNLGARFGKRMEVLGGIILIIIGLRTLFTHLFV